jgi:hypothetical protein
MASDQFHRDEPVSILLAEIQASDNVPVLELAHHMGLALKSL